LVSDPATRAVKAVVRKGGENYLCLLTSRTAAATPPALAGADWWDDAAARGCGRRRDGDMTGGDFRPGCDLFAISPAAQAAPQPGRPPGRMHARRLLSLPACFIEKAIRGVAPGDIVIANHAGC